LFALPALGLFGCATQQSVDAQSSSISQQLEALKQAQAGLATTQQDLQARLAKLESGQAGLAARIYQGDPASAALKRALDALREQATTNQSGLAALTAKVESQAPVTAAAIDQLRDQSAATQAALSAQTAQIAQAQTTAEDAVKIARDSRLVSGKVIDSLVLSEGMIMYGYEYPELMASGRAALDKLIAGVRPQMPHVFIEIIGFSDDISLGSQNRRIALERAEAVRRYLHEVGDIPLHRMSAISYGDLKPLSSDPTYEGRRQNRRVLVQVLK
jgi:outer membrane protein OmpA-like peptidoglycan-associated protein